ncbi:copper homeostasis protein CutC [Vibrio maerlii]|uniref:copper homeostasis protein CutC n=1 Tax=Vibrio maerlii TaxID=2231648 RepID=UPI000E3D51EB
MLIEVCIDNIESLKTAIKAGAERIELCSALALGGLTPSLGLIREAVKRSSVPVYVMIRPREGDFVFNDIEVEMMKDEITTYKSMGVDGVVVGALYADGTINTHALSLWTKAADGIGVTFHRAFDLVKESNLALETLIEYQVERVLTSGLNESAELGIPVIERLVSQADGRISIMAGAGVNAQNARFIAQTGVQELHLSGKTQRQSLMASQTDVSMGSESCENTITVTDYDKVNMVVREFK